MIYQIIINGTELQYALVSKEKFEEIGIQHQATFGQVIERTDDDFNPQKIRELQINEFNKINEVKSNNQQDEISVETLIKDILKNKNLNIPETLPTCEIDRDEK